MDSPARYSLAASTHSKALSPASNVSVPNVRAVKRTDTIAGRSLVQQRCLDAILVASFLVGSFSAIWLPGFREARVLFGLILGVMAVRCWSSPVESGRTAAGNARDAWRSMMTLTLTAAVFLYLICVWTGAFHHRQIFELADKSWRHWLSVKLPTVIGQQVMLQILLAPILFRLFKRKFIAALAGALIFALLHLPNPVLVLLTFVAGAVWIAAFHRARRLTPIIVSHFVLAVVAAGFCGEYIFGMRVGPSCLALFPQRIEGSQSDKYEFPRCVVGRAERLVQADDELMLKGWVLDPIHGQAPTALYLMVNGRLDEIHDVHFERVPASHWENADESGFVDDYCYSFTAVFPVSRIGFDQEALLFAANANGHLGRVEKMGEISPVAQTAAGQPIVLFPVEVDGRINHVVRKPDGLHLIGWAADMRDRSLLEKICFEYEGQFRTFELEPNRSPRPGIVKAMQAPALQQSGFDIDLGPISIFYLKNLRCFGVDREQQLHPIQLTETAETNVARLMDGVPGNTIWR